MTRIVYRMRDRGLVKIESSKDDGRVSVVTATAKGFRLRNNAWKGVQQTTSNALDGLDDHKIDELNKSLSILFELLEDQYQAGC